MVSSNLSFDSNNQTLLCAVRREWVAAQPEEWVRQRILAHMFESLGYPPSAVTVEKALRSLPHVSLIDRGTVPDRRADILVFSKGVPLLLIECKAVKLTSKVIRQVVGYNNIVQAPYVAIANEEEVRTGWFDSALGDYQFVPYLPSYEQIG